MQITWAMTWVPTNFNKTFNPKGILYAHHKMERYFNVKFVQVPKNPQYVIHLANWDYPGGAMWASGRTITVGKSFNFKNLLEFCGQCILHEWGHILGRSNKHAPQGKNIMAPVLSDQYLNFSQADVAWYTKTLRWKNNTLRPWHEPEYWRPRAASLITEVEPVTFGCSPSWTSYIRNFDPRIQYCHVEE